jgi:uncharacterized protein (TIGR02246 family)
VATPRLCRALIPLLAGLVVLALRSPLAAQAIPGMPQGPTGQEMATEYQLAVRKELTTVLQDWTTLWERDQADALARYYTDMAMLLPAGGGVIHGRDAIRQAWTRELPSRGTLQAELVEVLAGGRLAYATGRLAYQVTGDDGAARPEMQMVMMLFEKQRGRWLIRTQAFARTDASTAAQFGRNAVRPARGAVYPPERPIVRLVFEPFAGKTEWQTRPQQAPWSFAGGTLGLELGRTLELRGHYWQAMDAEEAGLEPLRSYGGELRAHLRNLWRLQPQVLLGAAKLSGSVIPDSMIVPTAGAGLGFRVTNGVSLQFAARDYFPRKPDAPETEGWATLERSQYWMFSGGLSYALGRQPAWRDPVPSPQHVASEARLSLPVSTVMDEWVSAVQRGEPGRVAAHYTATSSLLEPHQVHRRGEEISEYWTARAQRGAAFQVLEVRISDRVAVVTSAVTTAGGGASAGEGRTSGRLVTVLEQHRGRWTIRAQAFAPAP